MRIAMFLDTDFPPDSRVENEAISLIQAGHDVHLFSLSYKPFDSNISNINGITVHRYRSNKLIYKLSALVYTFPIFSILIYPKIQDFIKRVSPDALHIHDMPLAEVVFRANKKNGLPVVLDLHEDRPEIMKFYPHLNKFPGNMLISPSKWARKQIELMQRADKVILVTSLAKTKFLNINDDLKEKIIVVPNTINPTIFYKYPLKDSLIKRFAGQKVILYLGDTGLRRGTDTSIKAMYHVLKKVPNARLVLVGRSSDDLKLHDLADDLQLTDKVIFEGWQDVSLFPSYIESSSVCISPLKRNPHHDTTYANKIFQYMAMGKPVVVSDCPAQQQVIEQARCGLVHEADNEHDLAEKLITILTQDELAENLSNNAKNSVLEKWNWNETSKELLNYYAAIEKN